MTWIKYILHCIGSLLGAYIAADGVAVNANESVVGLLSLGTIGLVYTAIMVILSVKTNLDLKIRTLCSIGVTVLVIGIIFAIMILVEYLIQR